MNIGPLVRFVIPVNLELPAHKVSLLVQTELGGVDLPVEKGDLFLDPFRNERHQVLTKVKRFISCIIDLAIAKFDSVTLKTALLFHRSVAAGGWDDTAMQMKLVDLLDITDIRALIAKDIKSLEALEYTEQHNMEAYCRKPPPWGRKVLDFLKSLPKLRVSISMVGKPVSCPQ
jgi:ATP-dependent DNA helicase HFM1/MER3